MGSNCTNIEHKLGEAMPWVGRYILAASTLCTLAMAADAFNSFRHKKLCFPCKYFSLNAISLTLLGVAMKLPMDLTIYTEIDMMGKVSGILFMSTAMGNFMSSLGSMNNKNILPNVVALVILVITVAADLLFHYILLGDPVILSSMIVMLFSLATLVSLSVTIPITKRNLESKYKAALREEEILERREAIRIDNQKAYMMKYLVMAETSSPQFVMARSVVCTASVVICLVDLLQLPSLLLTSYNYVSLYNWLSDCKLDASQYGESTKWIIYIQITGIVIGTVAPALRWFLVAIFICSTINMNSFKRAIKIENYWTQTLVDLRDSFSALHIQQNKYRRCLHDAKWFAITFCIGLQILIVRLSKLVIFVSALIICPFFLCFTHIKKFVQQNIGHDEAGGNTDLNLRHYVLLLEGETELPTGFLKIICRDADNIIRTGKKKQPQNLIDLLREKFVNFNGVGEFDSDKIQSLHSQEPPNCWTLPVVTLTSIAIALPNIAKHNCKRLLSSVCEGLSLARTVEKTFDRYAQLVNIRKAADVTWVRVVLYTKWQGIDLRRTSLNRKNSKEVLLELSNEAKKTVDKFEREVKDPFMEDPLNWPTEVVAANSMYRISRTILLSCEEDEHLFERLSVMIADILAACLTNLPHVITTMCHCNAIEKREKSARKAFLLLGQTEQVVQLLQQREWPFLDHDKAADIEEWRALFQQDKEMQRPQPQSLSCETMSTEEEHSAITVDR